MEVTLLSAKKCLALLLFFITANAAYPNFSINTVAASEDVPFNLSYSPEEYNFGSDLLRMFTDLSKNKLDKKLAANLFKAHWHIKAFPNINPVLVRINDIIEIDTQDSFYQKCAIKVKNPNEYTESLEERMDIAIDAYCRNLYLKRMASFSSSINFSSRDLAFFKEAAPFFLSGENQQDLVTMLKHFKQNIPEHEKISNLIIDRIIETKTRPPSQVLTNLRVSSKFNQYLQSRINLDESSLSYFQEEFQKSIRDMQDAIENGDFGLARQLSTGTIRFYNQNKNFISDKRAFIGFIISAKAFYYKGKDKESSELFEMARTVAPKEEFSEAHFYLVWPYIVEKDIKGLKKAIDKYNLEKDFDKFDSKLQYWIAYAEFKIGDQKKATDFYNKIITTSPYSFYSIISLKDLALSSKGKTSEEEILAKLVTKNNPKEYPINKYHEQLKSALKRFAIWSKLGNERFQTLEIRKVQSLSKEETFDDEKLTKDMTTQIHKEFITINLIRLLNSKKRYISSFKIFQDSVEQNSLTLNLKILKHIFPLSYIDIIKKNALNIDPLIIISLIRQESAFNPEAMSGVGAKGLMQLMPTTAKRFNNKVKVKHLSNPDINVAIGTKYLRNLITRYEGNLIYALASYNAGENRIDRWRKDIFKTDDPLATIESIPYEETRNYVKLIYRNYFFYNLIQNKSILKTPIEESFKVTLNKNID